MMRKKAPLRPDLLCVCGVCWSLLGCVLVSFVLGISFSCVVYTSTKEAPLRPDLLRV